MLRRNHSWTEDAGRGEHDNLVNNGSRRNVGRMRLGVNRAPQRGVDRDGAAPVKGAAGPAVGEAGGALAPPPAMLGSVEPVGSREAQKLRILRAQTAVCSGWVEAKRSFHEVKASVRDISPVTSSSSAQDLADRSDSEAAEAARAMETLQLRRELSSPDLVELNRATAGGGGSQDRPVPNLPPITAAATVTARDVTPPAPPVPSRLTPSGHGLSRGTGDTGSGSGGAASDDNDRNGALGAGGRANRAQEQEQPRMRLAPTTKAAPAPPPQRVAALRGRDQRSAPRDAPAKAKSAGGLMGKTGLAKAMSRLFAPKKPPMESLANVLSLGLIGKKHRHDEWNPYWIEVRAGLLVFYEGERDHSRAKAAPFVILPLVGCKVYCHAAERCREENMLMFERVRQFRLANALDGDAPKALYNPNCPCRWAFEAEQRAKSGKRGKLSEADDPLVLQIQPASEFSSLAPPPSVVLQHGGRVRSIKLRFDSVEQLFNWYRVISLYAQQRVVSRADFELLCLLGKGAFGKVALARDLVASGELVSIKFMDRQAVFSSRDKLRRMVDERMILQAVTGKPYFVRLLYAFETGESLCMVNNFCEGGDLFHFLFKFHQWRERQVKAREEAGERIDWEALRKHKRALPVPVARFIAAEILMALQSMHESDIVYRDLKPENVLIDDEGHVCVTDFGLARVLRTFARDDPNSGSSVHDGHGQTTGRAPSPGSGGGVIKPGRLGGSDLSSSSSFSSMEDEEREASPKEHTPGPKAGAEESSNVRQRAFSFCGTKSYIAPEMLKTRSRAQLGYGFSVDIWAFGVLLYDLLVGRPPFYSSDRERSFQLTLTAKLYLPEHLDAVSADLLVRLLEKDETRRIGCRTSYATDFDEIKRHPFFAEVDWDAVARRQLPVPSEITEVLQLSPEAVARAVHEQHVDTSSVEWLARNFDKRFVESDMRSLIASLNRAFDPAHPTGNAVDGHASGALNAAAIAEVYRRNKAGSIPGFMFMHNAANVTPDSAAV